MSTKKRKLLNSLSEWEKAKMLANGIYQLSSTKGRYCYGFIFPGGTKTVFSHPRPIPLEGLRLLYKVEVKARRDQEQIRKGVKGSSPEDFDRTRKRRRERLQKLGLLFERDEDVVSLLKRFGVD